MCVFVTAKIGNLEKISKRALGPGLPVDILFVSGSVGEGKEEEKIEKRGVIGFS